MVVLAARVERFWLISTLPKNGLDIPIIDIHLEVFADHPDPLALFPLRIHGHHNAEGYSKVGKAITDNVQ